MLFRFVSQSRSEGAEFKQCQLLQRLKPQRYRFTVRDRQLITIYEATNRNSTYTPNSDTNAIYIPAYNTYNFYTQNIQGATLSDPTSAVRHVLEPATHLYPQLYNLANGSLGNLTLTPTKFCQPLKASFQVSRPVFFTTTAGQGATQATTVAGNDNPYICIAEDAYGQLSNMKLPLSVFATDSKFGVTDITTSNFKFNYIQNKGVYINPDSFVNPMRMPKVMTMKSDQAYKKTIHFDSSSRLMYPLPGLKDEVYANESFDNAQIIYLPHRDRDWETK